MIGERDMGSGDKLRIIQTIIRMLGLEFLLIEMNSFLIQLYPPDKSLNKSLLDEETINFLLKNLNTIADKIQMFHSLKENQKYCADRIIIGIERNEDGELLLR